MDFTFSLSELAGIGVLFYVVGGGTMVLSEWFADNLFKIWAGLKLLVALALLPVLVPLFFVWNDAFLVLFTALWPHLDILSAEEGLYLRRFFMTPKTRWFRPRFLHYIRRSDAGRDPHDHPGRFVTRILRGGYWEMVYLPRDPLRKEHGLVVDRRAVPEGRTLDNPEGHTHMVELYRPTWTWVVAWIRGKPWGFWILDPEDGSKDRWVESEAYGVKGDEIKSWEQWP